MKIKFFAILGIMGLSLAGCNSGSESSENETVMEEPAKEMMDVTGNYVSNGYDQRNEGYDWVSVTVTQAGENKVSIHVRSRADKKRPTCTFDAVATAMNDSMYSSDISGKKVLYIFRDTELVIKPENMDDEGILFFYCSGGASVADTYKKISEPLDAAQIDPTVFASNLNLQGIGFNISSVVKDGKTMLTVEPYGLQKTNDAVTIEVNGIITNAEVEDINSDGSPDLLVYSQTTDAGKYGNVHGFTTNNKKSMSFIYFPPVAENKDLKTGYQGHDEFAIVENSLIQKFPIFENGTETGKTRQISYKLKEGEATRGFAVDKVIEL